MHKTHPVPKTSATKVPKVDRFITDYLKSRFPKGEDSELAKIEAGLLRVCGPMTCLWAELINNSLLSNPNGTVNVYDVLNIIQCSLVLLGNTNEMISQFRRMRILQQVDKSLESMARSPS